MPSEPLRIESKTVFGICAMAGAVPGTLVAFVMMMTGRDKLGLLAVLLCVPFGVWIATTVAHRYGRRGVLLVMLVVFFAFVVFERWFARD